MVKVLNFGVALLAYVSLQSVHAAPAPMSEAQKGGALLEFPRGRFQENVAPSFFKWTLRKPVKTVTLKVFRANMQAKYDPEKDLITSFDFMPSVQSMSWAEEILPIGHYVWVIEGYDEKSPAAIYMDSARFEIEPLRQFEAKTLRLGLIAGFARGNYNSIDPDHKINFRTTPTTYGLLLSGGDEHRIWEINGYMSDFILRGSVHRTTNLATGYYWGFLESNAAAFELFWGATFRVTQFPQVRSPDGVEISSKNVTIGVPGMALTGQMQLDQHIMLHAHLGYELPVVGSQEVEIGLDKASYAIRAGMLYSLFWPLGFNGELQYRLDQAALKDGSETVTMQMDQWAIVANLIYAL